MLDVVNEDLVARGEEPIAFDHDCREGICGTCGFLINGKAHGGQPRTTVCQLHMRKFHDGDTLTLEPWRAKAFPVVRDLIVDRSGLRPHRPARRLHHGDRPAGAPDANAIPVAKNAADLAFDAATCIGCGRVRRGVSKRVGVALHRVEGLAPGSPAAGAARALARACST
jgi:succinate dehydrogenase / fumarate reductase iron-sulfur subunit